ncbi:hypothetical protein T11_15134 [Trichinella zimbabwensis]|uniref:Uncharacterized protein n=1 Tax=Trichinella zimbabwensis TaxID=268475 RepID=A0A0V1I5J6_9BILA|nr:hypothetical protein T11_15134 [Trichinella zimbabwensis]
MNLFILGVLYYIKVYLQYNLCSIEWMKNESDAHKSHRRTNARHDDRHLRRGSVQWSKLLDQRENIEMLKMMLVCEEKKTFLTFDVNN